MEATYSKTTFTKEKSLHTTASLIHLSTLLKYFFPFANFIAPLLIWTFNKDKDFIDEHGRQAINFQLSILLYSVLICLLCIPFVLIFATDFISLIQTIDQESGNFSAITIQNISGYVLLIIMVILILLALFIFELYAVINASIHANRGEYFKYPLCIPFIKTKRIKTL